MTMVDVVEDETVLTFLPSTFAKGRMLNLRLREHLQKVYATVIFANICVTAGAFFSSRYLHGLFTVLILFSCYCGIWMLHNSVRDNGRNRLKRLAILSIMGFLYGCLLKGFIHLIIAINPVLIMDAMALTTITFACFSQIAPYSPREGLLFTSGLLSTTIVYLSLAAVFNHFPLGPMLHSPPVYSCCFVILVSLFVVYDTRVIIQKHRDGDTDYIRHAWALVSDFHIFFSKIIGIYPPRQLRKRKKQ